VIWKQNSDYSGLTVTITVYSVKVRNWDRGYG